MRVIILPPLLELSASSDVPTVSSVEFITLAHGAALVEW